MKLNSLPTVLSVLLAVVLIPISTSAQANKLTERDKTLIIQSILKRYDFIHAETWRDNRENIVYLLSENISPAQIPSRKGIKFVVIERDQIERRRKSGIEYYRFSAFETAKTVQVSFIRTYLSDREGNGSVMEYTCHKVSGRWKLKGRLDGIFAS